MPRALIIVDHGSTRAAANRLLEELAQQVQQLTTDAVYPAHMELAGPTLDEAFDAAVAGGADFIYVFPYFLAPGRHSQEDIPRLCEAAAGRHPGIRWHVSAPIGLDGMLAQLIVHRMRRCAQYHYSCEDCPQAARCRPRGDWA